MVKLKSKIKKLLRGKDTFRQLVLIKQILSKPRALEIFSKDRNDRRGV